MHDKRVGACRGSINGQEVGSRRQSFHSGGKPSAGHPQALRRVSVLEEEEPQIRVSAQAKIQSSRAGFEGEAIQDLGPNHA